MYDGNGGRIYLSTNPYYVSSSQGSDQNSILPGGLVVYEAVYNITQADAYTGFIENMVKVSGTVPSIIYQFLTSVMMEMMKRKYNRWSNNYRIRQSVGI